MMSDFYAVMRSRADNSELQFIGLDVQPTSYSKHVLGGCKEAKLAVRGPALALWECLKWLRNPLDIYHQFYRRVWWGLITSVELHIDGEIYKATLDTMTNRIKVAYMQDNVRGTTAWSADAASIAIYGYKETILSGNNLTAAAATAQAALQLARFSTPGAKDDPSAIFNPKSEAVAYITCRGWYSTLDWQRAILSLGKEEYATLGTGYRSLGWGNDITPPYSYVTAVEQIFMLADSEGWYLDAVEVPVAIYTDTTDSLLIKIYADSAGSLGSLLETITVPYTEVTSAFNAFGWIRHAAAGTLLIAAATSYHIALYKNGANSPTLQYYWMGNQAHTYARGGVAKDFYNGAWVASDRNMGFRLFGTWTNTHKIERLLDQWQFGNGYTVTGTYAAKSSPILNGDTTLLTEVEKQMLIGVSDGRRLLLTVNADRSVDVAPEPLPTAVGYYLQSDGTLRDSYWQQQDWLLCPVGQWIKKVDSPPPGVVVASDSLDDPSMVFYDGLEYNCISGTITSSESRAYPTLGGR